jgi:hypothetical protein
MRKGGLPVSAAVLLVASLATDARPLEADQLSQPMIAEEAFASLLYGRYFRDPCAGSSDNSVHCTPVFSDKRIIYQDAKSKQTYQLTENPCIIEAVSQSAASGKSYRATFHLENAQSISAGDVRENGRSKEYAFTFQGKGVVDFDGKGGNLLIFLHKYHVNGNGEPSHDVKVELAGMRALLKNYQSKFCPGMT